MPDIERIAEAVNIMYKDLYVGEGKLNPSVTSRIALLEETVKSISSNLGKMVWLLVGIFVTVIGDIIVHDVLVRAALK